MAWSTIRLLPRGTGVEVRSTVDGAVIRGRAPWRDKRIVFLGIAILGLTIGEGAGNDWLALAMVDDYLADPIRASIAFAVMMAAMTIVRFTGGMIVDRLGRVVALRSLAIAGIAGLLLIILSHNYLSAAADGDDSSRKVSTVASFGYIAFLVGPPTLGFLGQTWGLLNMFYVLVALLAVSVIFVGAARPERE